MFFAGLPTLPIENRWAPRILFEMLDARFQEMLDFLEKAVKIPAVVPEHLGNTPLDQREMQEPEGEPVGRDLREKMDLFEMQAQQLGLTVTRDPRGLYMFAETNPGADKRIDFATHLDKVGAKAEEWRSGNPHKLVVEMVDGRLSLVGRGVVDDTGPAVQNLFALSIVNMLTPNPDVNVRLAFFPTEERGVHFDVWAYLAAEGYPRFAYVADDHFAGVAGEQDIYRFNIEGEGKPLDEVGATVRIKSITTDSEKEVNKVPEVIKAVFEGPQEDLDRLEAGMQPALQRNTFFSQYNANAITFVFDKSVPGQMTVTIHGKEAHTAYVEDGINAVQVLAASLTDVALVDSPAGRLTRFIQKAIGYDYLGSNFGFDKNIDLKKTGRHILNPSILTVGDGMQTVFRFDNRSRLDVPRETVDEQIGGAAARHGLTMKPTMFKRGVMVNQDAEECQLGIAVYGRHAGVEEPKIADVTPGGTYAKAFTPKPGTPEASDPNLHGAMIFGPLMPGDPVTEHQPNERMPIDTFSIGMKIYLDTMYALGVDHTDTNVVGLKTIDNALSASTITTETLDRLDGMSKGLKLHPAIVKALKAKFELRRAQLRGERL